LKIFDSLKSKLVYGNNVRQVLPVETGNVDAGIVYIGCQRIQICQGGGNGTGKFTFTNVYPVAVLKDTKNAAAARSLCNFCLALRHYVREIRVWGCEQLGF